MQVEKQALDFLQKLKENNNRDWFADNKSDFTKAQDNVKAVFAKIQEDLEAHDEIDKFKLYRIYRDVRFSKDKTPYKTHFSGSYSRKGKHLRGGYYLQISPEESFLAGGFWAPEKDDLLRIRKEIEMDDTEFREILNAKEYKQYFGGEFRGDELKTAPKGFDKTHPAIDLIRKKGYIAVRNFSTDEVLADNFLEEVAISFTALRPFFDLFSDVLTTNLNGESLL